MELDVLDLLERGPGLLEEPEQEVVLGTGRGATFSALVPGFTVLIGVLALGEMPTLIQLGGLAVVAVGFRYVMKQ